MKKSLLKLIIFLMFILYFLSACNNKGAGSYNESKADQKDVSDIPKDVSDNNHVSQELSSGVEVNADVDILDTVEVNALSEFYAQPVVQNYEKAKQLFLGNKEIIDEETREDIPESMTNSPYIYCQTSDDYTLTSSGADLRFGGELESKIFYFFKDSYEDGNSHKFLTGKELEFQSIEKAGQEIEDIIYELGISTVPDPICYTIDYENAKSESDKINKYIGENADESSSGFNPVTIEEKDECYLFAYQISAEGLPISRHSNGVYGDGSFTMGTTVWAIYSADGIVQFSIDYQFEIAEAYSQDKKGMNVQEALRKLDQKYNSIILEGEYSIVKIEFEYVPLPRGGNSSNYSLVPAWRFKIAHTYELSGKETPNDTTMDTRFSDVVFHAVTGEEIITDMGSI